MHYTRINDFNPYKYWNRNTAQVRYSRLTDGFLAERPKTYALRMTGGRKLFRQLRSFVKFDRTRESRAAAAVTAWGTNPIILNHPLPPPDTRVTHRSQRRSVTFLGRRTASGAGPQSQSEIAERPPCRRFSPQSYPEMNLHEFVRVRAFLATGNC